MNETATKQVSRPLLRRPIFLIVTATVLALTAIALWAFQPWKLFTSSRVDEALPSAPAVSATVLPTVTSALSTVPSATTQPATPMLLRRGTFVSQEHQTSGTASIIQLADGSRILRLEKLASSDGPDLHVWLTDQDAGGSWHKYDDGRYIQLGKLKATHGNQNYVIPANADLAGLRSAVIWCDRFNVAFGSAPLG